MTMSSQRHHRAEKQPADETHSLRMHHPWLTHPCSLSGILSRARLSVEAFVKPQPWLICHSMAVTTILPAQQMLS